MDTSPTIFISVFLQETPHFLASVTFLEAQIQGYYHTKVSINSPPTHILIITSKTTGIGDSHPPLGI